MKVSGKVKGRGYRYHIGIPMVSPEIPSVAMIGVPTMPGGGTIVPIQLAVYQQGKKVIY
jgi:hypothetical protein